MDPRGASPPPKVGVGLHLGKRVTGELIVTGVKPAGPAEAAGITADTIILIVNNISVHGLELQQVRDLIVGEAGTYVQIHMQEPGSKVSKIHNLVRRAMPKGAPSTPSQPPPGQARTSPAQQGVPSAISSQRSPPAAPPATPNTPTTGLAPTTSGRPLATTEQVQDQQQISTTSLVAGRNLAQADVARVSDWLHTVTPDGLEDISGRTQAEIVPAKEALSAAELEGIVATKISDFTTQLWGKLREEDEDLRAHIQDRILSLTDMVNNLVQEFGNVRTDIEEDQRKFEELENRVQALTQMVQALHQQNPSGNGQRNVSTHQNVELM